MPVFPKPRFTFQYDAAEEINSLRQHKTTRLVPEKSPGSILLATWNIANLGAQERRDTDYQLIAEVISWFDLVAIQETREDLAGLRAIQRHLPGSYGAFFTDAAGNNERMVYFCDAAKLATREQIGELALEPKDLKNIKLPGVAQKFDGFDRNPFHQSFKFGSLNFTLVNVHLYYGSDRGEKVQRRQLETYALARWAKRQSYSKTAYDPNLILLGDFNLPYMEDGDPIYSILKKHGILLTEHATGIGATLPSETGNRTEKVKHYDQIAFFPNTKEYFTAKSGVFDFDAVVFKKLWEDEGRTQQQFNAYVRYYVSDHRPFWAELRPRQ
jgi:endonuclease/exonuclease/phosphatase family metal-dependent hydrolase